MDGMSEMPPQDGKEDTLVPATQATWKVADSGVAGGGVPVAPGSTHGSGLSGGSIRHTEQSIDGGWGGRSFGGSRSVTGRDHSSPSGSGGKKVQDVVAEHFIPKVNEGGETQRRGERSSICHEVCSRSSSSLTTPVTTSAGEQPLDSEDVGTVTSHCVPRQGIRERKGPFGTAERLPCASSSATFDRERRTGVLGPSSSTSLEGVRDRLDEGRTSVGLCSLADTGVTNVGSAAIGSGERVPPPSHESSQGGQRPEVLRGIDPTRQRQRSGSGTGAAEAPYTLDGGESQGDGPTTLSQRPRGHQAAITEASSGAASARDQGCTILPPRRPHSSGGSGTGSGGRGQSPTGVGVDTQVHPIGDINGDPTSTGGKERDRSSDAQFWALERIRLDLYEGGLRQASPQPPPGPRQEQRQPSPFPTYAEFLMCGSHLPRKLARPPPLYVNGDMSTARFAESAVETVDVRRLRPWVPDEVWRTIEVIVDYRAFENRVLLPDWLERLKAYTVARRRGRSTNLSRFHIDDLRAKGYIRRARSVRFVCSAFAVWKSDLEFLRLIWNGTEFNLLCRPPPHFTITPLSIALARLLDPSVMAYLTYDFRTWFIQLTVVAEVREFFAVRFPSGEVWILTGVPMGWSWACAIAHSLTQAFARAVVVKLGLRSEEATFDFCIDNTIIALRTLRISPATVYEMVVEMAASFGIVLKGSATEMGSRVEWLPYKLDLVTGSATLKPSLRTKLMAMSPPTDPTTLIDIWRACGLVVWSSYAAMWPLTRVKEIMRWLASSAPGPEEQDRWNEVRIFPLWTSLVETARELAGTVIPHPCGMFVSPDADSVWFLADAASTGNCSYIVFTGKQMIRRIWPAIAGVRIEESELLAFVEGLGCAVGESSGKSAILGYSDNTTALSAVWNGYSLWASQLTARRLEDTTMDARRAGGFLAAHVGTHKNIPDVWTRIRIGGRKLPEWAAKPRCLIHTRTLGRLCSCDEETLRQWDVPSEKMPVLEAYFREGPSEYRHQIMSGKEWDWWGEYPRGGDDA